MEIILISKARHTRGPIHLGSIGSRALFVSLALVCLGLAYGGFRLGISAAAPPGPVYSVAVDPQVERQRLLVDRAIRNTEADLNALALRLGELQAQIIRLDALGARLVDMAGLDEQEFDFSSPPARGGPQKVTVLRGPHRSDLLARLERVAAELEDRAPKLKALENVLMQRKLRVRMQPSGRPVEHGWISSYFGYRNDPVTGKRAFHEGVDFAARRGSEVIAAAAGVVKESRYRPGYGNVVEVRHPNGYTTRYAHNEENLVEAGDIVKRGQRLALVGDTGRSTGSHVHFEVLEDGNPVDPLSYVRAATPQAKPQANP